MVPGSRDGKWPGCVCHSLLGTARHLEGPVRPLPCCPGPKGQWPRSLTRPGQAHRAPQALSLQGPRELLLGYLACGPGLALHSPPPSPPETWRQEPPAGSRAEPEGSASWPLGLPLAPSAPRQAPNIQRSPASACSACPTPCLSPPQLWSPHPSAPGSQVCVRGQATVSVLIFPSGVSALPGDQLCLRPFLP